MNRISAYQRYSRRDLDLLAIAHSCSRFNFAAANSFGRRGVGVGGGEGVIQRPSYVNCALQLTHGKGLEKGKRHVILPICGLVIVFSHIESEPEKVQVTSCHWPSSDMLANVQCSEPFVLFGCPLPQLV